MSDSTDSTLNNCEFDETIRSFVGSFVTHVGSALQVLAVLV